MTAEEKRKQKLTKLFGEICELGDELKIQARQSAGTMVVIGKKLIEAKKLCKHGEWLPWLGRLHWKETTAKEYMSVAKLKSPHSGDLNIDMTALKKLAAPSTPPAVRREYIERAQQPGAERVTNREIERRLASVRPTRPPTPVTHTTRDIGPAEMSVLSLTQEIQEHLEEMEQLENVSQVDDSKLSDLEEVLSTALRFVKQARQSRMRVIQGGRS